MLGHGSDWKSSLPSKICRKIPCSVSGGHKVGREVSAMMKDTHEENNNMATSTIDNLI